MTGGIEKVSASHRRSPSACSRGDRLPDVALLAAWVIADDNFSDYTIAIVSGFALIVAAIQFALWRTWRRNRDPDTFTKDRGSFADWASGEFEPGSIA
jgi:hypothetical protein